MDSGVLNTLGGVLLAEPIILAGVIVVSHLLLRREIKGLRDDLTKHEDQCDARARRLHDADRRIGERVAKLEGAKEAD